MIFPTDFKHSVAPISGVVGARKVEESIKINTRDYGRLEQYYQQMAVITDDTFYYRKLLEVRQEKRELEACLKEIQAKWPYDGKKTFWELVEERGKG